MHNDNNVSHETGLLLFQMDGLGFGALEFCTKRRTVDGIWFHIHQYPNYTYKGGGISGERSGKEIGFFGFFVSIIQPKFHINSSDTRATKGLGIILQCRYIKPLFL